MGILGGTLGYGLLKRIAPRHPQTATATGQARCDGDSTELTVAYGPDIFDRIRGQRVIDFGCGTGHDAVRMAQQGASHVIGLDIQERFLIEARHWAQQQGVAQRCEFSQTTQAQADIILSKDAFEHFDDPAAILATMSRLLKPEGVVLATFGPTWLHPLGGHLFSVFPWSHLIFSEEALIRWRSDFKRDGARRFREVAGGLNQLTIAEFERLVASSPLKLDWLETVPIKGIGLLKTPALREFGSSLVRCQLSLR